MECWHCNRPAHGTCRFCGRAICRDHAQRMPFVLEMYRGKDGEMKAVVVNEALYCGLCKPEDAPVTLKNME